MPRIVDINAETGEVFITEIPDPVEETALQGDIITDTDTTTLEGGN